MLELSGNLGYGNVTVATLIERSGSNRSHFYATFGSKDGCYASAYDAAIGGLESRLLGSCKDGPWVVGVRRALSELARFIHEDRDFAAGVLVGVYAAGEAAAARRSEAWARLSRAVDRGRREVPQGKAPPPPQTATFVLQSIETAVIRSLSGDSPLIDELPGLLYLAVAPYLGPTVAWAEIAKGE